MIRPAPIQCQMLTVVISTTSTFVLTAAMASAKAIVVFLLFCVCLVVGSEYVTEDPQSQPVHTGGNVTLYCDAENYTTVQWVRGEPPVVVPVMVEEGRVEVEGNRLEITDFHAVEHVGSYSCRFDLPGGARVFSCPANISHARITSNGFQEDPVDTEAVSGTTVVLRCSPPPSNPAPTISWHKDGQQLIPDSDRVFILPTGNLYILNVSLEDGGVYECFATNHVSGARRRSEAATLTVRGAPDLSAEDPPTVSDTPLSITFLSPHTVVTEGGVVVLECVVEGNPPPMITWQRVDPPTPLPPTPTGTLYIHNATTEDSGSYECFAFNGLSFLMRLTTVTVRAPPRVTIIPPPPLVAVGDILTCAVNGTDPVTVMWYGNGEILAFMEDAVPPLLLPLPPSLSPGPTLFQCLAHNPLGCDHAEVYLAVTGGVPSPSPLSPPPSVPTTTDIERSTPSPSPPPVTQPITVVLTPSEPVLGDLLTCQAGGIPLPTVSWYVNAMPRDSSQDVEFEGMVFSTITANTPGAYQCLATNGVGLQLASVNVTTRPVTESPLPSPSPSQPPATQPVTIQLTPSEPAFGDVLTCQAGGIPLPTVSWHVNGMPRDASQDFPHQGMVFSIITADTPGTYQCLASNEVDLQLAAVTVPPPSCPRVRILMPRVEVHEGDEANLTCIVQGSGDITIEWLFAGLPLSTHLQMVVEMPELRASYLVLPSVEASRAGVYECRAAAAHCDVDSGTVTLTVRSSPPTEAPQNLDVTFEPSGVYLVTWTPPPAGSLPSPLRGYKLNWDLVGFVSQSARVEVTTLFYEIDDLDPYQSYTVLVWAYSAGGDGPTARITIPPLLVTSSSPTTPPPVTSSSPTTPPPVTSSSPTTLPPEDTTPPPEDTTSTHLPSSTPLPPLSTLSITSCEAVSPTSAEIQWQVEGDASLLQSYELVSNCSEARTSLRHRLPPPTSTITLDHLLPACHYIFVVQALRGEEQIQSPLCEVRMPDGQVDIDAMVERLPNGTIFIRWTLPEGVSGEVEVNWGEGWREVGSGMHTLAHLDPAREYTIQIRVTIGQWQGALSTTVPTVSPAPTEEEDNGGASAQELGLLYGVIFGGLLVACAVVVLLILVMKYIQMSRRDSDKVTNHREKQQEAFRRMSLQRSSSSSIKKPFPTDRPNGVLGMPNGVPSNTNVYI